MANDIKEYATLIQNNLDKKMVQQSVTGWMEINSDQVKYSGGRTVKIPKMCMDGLGNYDRNDGFTGGSITLKYEEKEMKYDRGRAFTVDKMDVDETGFILSAGTVMNAFQEEHVAPEVDVVRLSTLAQIAIENKQVKYNYTADKKNAFDTLKDAITLIRENGFNGQLMIHCTHDFKTQLEKGIGGQLASTTINVCGVDIQIPSFDTCPLIPTVSNRMFTEYKLLDGKSSGEEEGGFEKAEKALSMNFMIVARNVPIAISKTDKLRIFDPDTNQKANAWLSDYRKYHDLWVLDNKEKGIYINVKEAEPTKVKEVETAKTNQ